MIHWKRRHLVSLSNQTVEYLNVSVPLSITFLQMYSLLLEVQDFEKRFVHAPEEDREALLEQHKTNTVQLCNSLREKEWDDRYEEGLERMAKYEYLKCTGSPNLYPSQNNLQQG